MSDSFVPPTPNSPLPKPDATAPLHITAEELAGEQVTRRVEEMARAQQVALVRDVGTATNTGNTSWLKAVGVLGLGGLVGGIAAFALQRVLFNVLNLFEENTFATNLTFSFVLAFAIGVCVALADAASSRSWSKVGQSALIAVPAALVCALILGLIAHFFYTAAMDWLYDNTMSASAGRDWSDKQYEDYVTLRLHPIRGVAWMFVGIAAGVAAATPARSWKRIGVAAAGGAVGGFLGGFVFDFFPGEAAAQFVGIVLLGVLIGVAMGLAEQATKSSWIEIVSGGLAGKQFILYKPQITLGSSPSADVTLIKDPALSDIAAVLVTQGGAAKITAAQPTTPIIVNGTATFGSNIRDGDIVTLGSTQLRFRQRDSKQRVPGALAS